MQARQRLTSRKFGEPARVVAAAEGVADVEGGLGEARLRGREPRRLVIGNFLAPVALDVHP
jgi:hypothetical protein